MSVWMWVCGDVGGGQAGQDRWGDEGQRGGQTGKGGETPARRERLGEREGGTGGEMAVRVRVIMCGPCGGHRRA